MGGQTLAFLAPYDYYANKSVQYVSFSKLDGNKGLNEEVPKEQPENEESTRRKYKNPSKGGNKNKPLFTPDLLYANTVDLKYDFLEFANRYCSPSLVFRFQYSNDLLNNLHNCNNKSHELSLDLKFNSLGVLINKPGSYQGNLKLRNDTTDGFISEVFQKEVFFYEEIEKDLTNPQLRLAASVNHVVYPISDASIAVGDEKIESQTFTHQIPYQADKREYSHAT
ncbi:3602_t:CDS:2 [Paraglomus brasilianum]|uniref:3602_t:CDS:1 n=1 Tax=Paraglomus brasilianum TaxID=144538 RepID=A0A9N9DDQ3_9GLOM|nr:3602_t:CDS:2 [Paraglomus brasilianum]